LENPKSQYSAMVQAAKNQQLIWERVGWLR